jgi:Domain of unknown function (DUF4332)/Zinc dependent phospholipase C
MTNILSILRTAHCRSTHHYFALDALRNLQTAQAQRLANILLKYHDDYLIGAKAPDSNFKDFQNHVIHVRDNNWGGAAIKCQEWLSEARQQLDNRNWKKAAYACGVLSHYFTDPLMPLHTAQSQREKAIHRPLEWSIYQTYNDIYAKATDTKCDIKLAVDDRWICKAVLAAAEVANRHYDTLIDSYDLERGVQQPRTGLTVESIEILAEIFALAIGGLSTVLTRLADETTAELPQVSLSLTSLLATIDRPLAWIVKRISDASERRAVNAILQEWKTTGDVRKYLPAEIARVEQARIEEPQLGVSVLSGPVMLAATLKKEANGDADSRRLDKLVLANPAELAVELPSQGTDSTNSEQAAPTLEATSSAGELAAAVEDDAAAKDTENELPLTSAAEPEPALPPIDSSLSAEPVYLPLSQARSRGKQRTAGSGEAKSNEPIEANVVSPLTTSSPAPSLRIAPGTDLPKQHRSPSVNYDSPLQDAPSIGPKTAKRFEKIGISTIRQFIESSAEEIVADLDTRWITVAIVKDWQDQARLVCEVPALNGYRAQLLVALGCRTSWQVRTANAKALSLQLEQFCQTAEGQQILRSDQVPVAQDVVLWIESARKYARREVA